MKHDHDQRGRFTPGNRASRNGGRPPRKYSVTHALAEIADQPATIDDEGNPITNAQLAAKWIWDKAISGMDDQGVPLPTKDRADCIKLALDRCEPVAGLLKQWEQHGDGDDDEQNQELEQQLKNLSDGELEILQKLGSSDE